jgi:hypothetical protein
MSINHPKWEPRSREDWMLRSNLRRERTPCPRRRRPLERADHAPFGSPGSPAQAGELPPQLWHHAELLAASSRYWSTQRRNPAGAIPRFFATSAVATRSPTTSDTVPRRNSSGWAACMGAKSAGVAVPDRPQTSARLRNPSGSVAT